ncbi:MAG: ATPase [Gammaproteobacteria bacterium RIFCSPHIGHO2_02_FULL_39_13]|nr:MAG: ATPase [Gammaproteobacteria bacterium RIFCSPHIGHO2_02_FULL_39_13]OGT48646.1 MAG: ATPase [Gammaproteobacteria bacterium RIFCSPHIGHO2_12_FULL_39_24]
MNNQLINTVLAAGNIDQPHIFPHLDWLKESPYVFNMDFGLLELPLEPGILLIRGARQYGKSTWLEQQLYQTIKQFGGGTAFYLNGDYITDVDALTTAIEGLTTAFSKDAPVRRLFIDEITTVQNWELALKRLADQGKLTKILVITTGSKATDLRRGAERMPGRKGKLSRTTYLFTPVSYREFKNKCGDALGDHTLTAYLLSGGSPVACVELAKTGVIPEYVIELVRDWVHGEITRSARSQTAVANILNVLFRFGGTPVGQAKLARESGLANNTIAANYIEILRDLGCVIPVYPWDKDRHQLILRKPCKYHFMNLLVAICYHPNRIRSVAEFLALSANEQGLFYEWLVTQEIMRRKAIQGEEILAPLAFYQDKNHEIDFVETSQHLIEVKRGQTSPLEFTWFAKQFPHQKLTVINTKSFQTNHVTGVSLETFLLEPV